MISLEFEGEPNTDPPLAVGSRFRAEDEFILLSSPRVTGPTNYDEDF